ncbi:hypothetical protein [Streptomyces sp. UH6]|uniref:hypothetical protein n=1 Tax=Streptomyces sp. UH6 TaxID=2748379 RepID=UPI00211EBCDF|nr:hypothetical protein [Streptomyces sp. UH6]
MEDSAAAVAVPAGRDRELSAETAAAIEASVAASTRRAYAADRRAFATWCTEQDRTTVPASGRPWPSGSGT